MEDILKRILARVEADEEPQRRTFDRDSFGLRERAAPIDILPALRRGFVPIAEVKRGSPSRGVIRRDFDPEALARAYERAGAGAVSVVTEKHFFFGDKTHLGRVKAAVGLPVLRKDFLTHEHQLYESFNLGADFVLLVVACLREGRLRRLCRTAEALGMRALVEVHAPDELRTALRVEAPIVGINNRDLKTFETDWTASLRLRSLVPPGVPVVSESGINRPAQVRILKAEGFSGVLVGEHLLSQTDPGRALEELLHG